MSVPASLASSSLGTPLILECLTAEHFLLSWVWALNFTQFITLSTMPQPFACEQRKHKPVLTKTHVFNWNLGLVMSNLFVLGVRVRERQRPVWWTSHWVYRWSQSSSAAASCSLWSENQSWGSQSGSLQIATYGSSPERHTFKSHSVWGTRDSSWVHLAGSSEQHASWVTWKGLTTTPHLFFFFTTSIILDTIWSAT